MFDWFLDIFGASKDRWMREKDPWTKRDLLGERIVTCLDFMKNNEMNVDEAYLVVTKHSVGVTTRERMKVGKERTIAAIKLSDFPNFTDVFTGIIEEDVNNKKVTGLTKKFNDLIYDLCNEIFFQVYGKKLY